MKTLTRIKGRIFSLFSVLMLATLGLVTALSAQPALAVSVSLDVSAGYGGTVTSPGQGIFYYESGTVVSLVAVASSGYTFSEWIGDDVSTIASVGSPTTTITMSGSYQITAYFIAGSGGGSSGGTTSYSITASAGTNGSISPAGTTAVASGGAMTYIITPYTGYRVADVLVDGTSVGPVTTYTFSSVVTSHTITATFTLNTFGITATAGSNGTITPSGMVSVSYGGSQTFTITPVDGYHVTGVTVDGVSAGAVNNYTFTGVVTAHTITASFAINTYTVTASAGDHGTISPAGASTVNFGASQAYTITPATGYHVADVRVDNASVGAVASYTISSVMSDHTIAASFAINTYPIVAGAGDHGTISPTGTTTVNYGGSQTYTITPATGYHIDTLQVDGATAASVTSYAFNNVTAAHTIAVSFAINTYTIKPTTGKHGSITPFTDVTVNYGDTQIFKFVPETGYRVADVTVDGQSVGAVSSYTFDKITADHTIMVTYTIGLLYYVAMGIGVLLVFLIGYLVGRRGGGGGF